MVNEHNDRQQRKQEPSGRNLQGTANCPSQIDEYFGLDTLKVIVRQPLAATETEGKFDVLVNVHGGGYTGQAGAIRHGVARALLQADNDYRPVLKAAGFLTVWGILQGRFQKIPQT